MSSVVYYKFKSCRDFSSLPISDQYISVASLKATIFKLKHLGRGKDVDLVISNAQTNEEYTDESSLIPRFTSVLVRPVPGRPRMRIRPHQEESGLFERREPPPGYVCHRCNQPGHFIQHCSTNGDPDYDLKRLKRPTGIPKSMLMVAPDGSYTLQGGGVAILQPDEAAFEKAIAGIPTLGRAASISTKLLPEGQCCPICKETMEDAVLRKCCFVSFCDKCIRGRIISESQCVCGSKEVRTDYLVPNRTLRRMIAEMLKAGATSSQDMSSSSAVSCLTVETKGPASGDGCSLEGSSERWEITEQKQSQNSDVHSPRHSRKRSFSLISI